MRLFRLNYKTMIRLKCLIVLFKYHCPFWYKHIIIWTGKNSNSWDDPNNWKPKQIPDEDSDVVFWMWNNVCCTLNDHYTVNTLTILGHRGTITLNHDLTIKGNVVIRGDGYIGGYTLPIYAQEEV